MAATALDRYGHVDEIAGSTTQYVSLEEGIQWLT
jgi:hypothetical protein